MLDSRPEMKPVVSESILVLPDNQGEITEQHSGGAIRTYIQPFINHFLPSQSNLTFEITMRGRGIQPSRSAGIHSLIDEVHTSDGSGSTKIESVIGYNSYVSQKYTATKSESNLNQRQFFEGLNSSNSNDENLYWRNSQSWYTGDGVDTPDVAKTVQIVTPIHTSLYQSSEFVNLAVLNGIRQEIILADPKKALSYTTSLGVDLFNALPSALQIPLSTTDLPAIGGGPFVAVPQFTVTQAGTGYTANTAHVFTAAPSGATGIIHVDTVTNANGVDVCNLFSTGSLPPDLSNTQCLRPGDTVTLAAVGGGTAAVLEVPANVNPVGAMRKRNPNVEFEFPIAQGIVYGDNIDSQGSNNEFGDGSVRNPFRDVPYFNPAYGKPFEKSISPFCIGDRLYINDSTATNGKALGLVTGLIKVDNRYVVKVCPDVAVSTDNMATSNPVLTIPYSINNVAGDPKRNGLYLYCKNEDRQDGWSPGANQQFYSTAVQAAAVTIGYTIKNWSMQVKRVLFPDESVRAQNEAARSERGYVMQFKTLWTQMVNVSNTPGQTSQLISHPQITKACGVLSVPLDQSKTHSYIFDSLVGVPDFARNYAYSIGTKMTPSRAVPLSKYSNNNPLHEPFHVNEWLKTFNSHGIEYSNVNNIGENFAVGRAFAADGYYFNLFGEGNDLSLKILYSAQASASKVFYHYLAHIRTLIINVNGIQVID